MVNWRTNHRLSSVSLRRSGRLQVLGGILLAALAAAACSSESAPPGERPDPVGDDGNVDDAADDNPPGDDNAPGDDVPVPVDDNAGDDFVDDDAPPAIPDGCGNNTAEDEEACDDGNNVSGDGCSAACDSAEEGFICPLEGGTCTRADVCGDGRQSQLEQCDDGNLTPDDGCSAICSLEDGWACTEPGTPCVNTVMCGDGIAAGNEKCDDLNTVDGDGCSANCTTVDDGWTCLPGAPCTEICGDGKTVGTETCDDGNTTSGDGCEANCILGPGFACDATGCHATVCGDGVKEGSEPCDDGMDPNTGDGCSPGCRLEPNCDSPDGKCTSNCGDGLLLPGDNEECDDGNDKNSDGCSSECKFEPGFKCDIVSVADEGYLSMPIVYRDFIGMGTGAAERADGHPDFENPEYSREGGEELDIPGDGPGTPGIVEAQLGPDGKPVYAQGTPYQTNGAESFNQWFNNVDGVNATVYGELTLLDNGDGTFIYDNPYFFPIDEAGLVASGTEDLRETGWFGPTCWNEAVEGDVSDVFTGPGSGETGADGNIDTHNFSFTSEVRYWFEYKGGEQLVFRGDDDVWVFIKNQLVVDLGGVHIPMGADVCGNLWCNDEELCDIAVAPANCAGLGPNTVDVTGQPLGLEVGRVYEAVVFQAERHTCQSNYRLTLSGFAQNRTECRSDCGDGVVAGDEICDDGAMNGAGYGYCTTECTPGPRCGDGEANGPEQCDKVLNVDGYRFDENSCAPGCLLPPFCGDGVLNANFGEQCDLGAEMNNGSYDGCNADCTLGPRCGDGDLAADFEKCDDGNRANNDGCNLVCQTERIQIAR